MRFNLFAMAAIMAVSNALQFNEVEEEFELPQTFDDVNDEIDYAEAYSYDDDEIDQDLAELDADLDLEAECPHKAAAPAAGGCGKCPTSDYEEGVKAKTQAALWDTYGSDKLRGKQLGGCLTSYNKGPVAAGGAGGCSGGCGGGAPAGGCGGGGHHHGGCNNLCDKAKEIIDKAKTTKCMKASQKDRQIEELRRKIEDKNKEVVKSKDEAAKMIEDMRKDCNQRFQKDQFATLTKDFQEMRGTMEKLLKSKKGEDAENAQLKQCLAAANCELKHLKEKVEEAEACPNKKGKGKKCGTLADGDKGFDDEPEDGEDCPVSTQILRARARNALAKLHAREQEHCHQCANRLTCCGTGPACPCGTQAGPGCPQKLTLRNDCKQSPCQETCNASPCGGAAAAAPAAAGPKTVQLRLSGSTPAAAPAEKK